MDDGSSSVSFIVNQPIKVHVKHLIEVLKRLVRRNCMVWPAQVVNLDHLYLNAFFLVSYSKNPSDKEVRQVLRFIKSDSHTLHS